MAQAALKAAQIALQTGQIRHGAGAADGLEAATLADAEVQAAAAADLADLRLAEARIRLALAKGGG